jgi:DNA-binding response OmpR family regulator
MVVKELPELAALLPKLQAVLRDILADRCDTEEELDALLQTLLNSIRSNTSPLLLEWGGLQLNPKDYRVMYHSTPIDLTPKEYEILELLMGNDRQVYSCRNILENLWDRQEAPSEEAVRTHIKCLRRKLKAAGVPADFVETVYGFGYRLKSLSSQDPQTFPLI